MHVNMAPSQIYPLAGTHDHHMCPWPSQPLSQKPQHKTSKMLIKHALHYMTVVNEKPIGVHDLGRALGLDQNILAELREAPRTTDENGKVRNENVMTRKLRALLECELRELDFAAVCEVVKLEAPALPDGKLGAMYEPAYHDQGHVRWRLTGF